MKRLTKAAIATGAAAFLLLGGAGTVAYWTGTGTATGTEVKSGTLTVTNGTCAAWTYTTASGGGPVTLAVPGDTVQTSCTVTVQGTGDHLGVKASFDPSTAGWTETNALVSALKLSEGQVQVDGNPVPAAGFSIADGKAHVLTLDVQAEFPYGDATQASINDTQSLSATLKNVAIQIVQTNTANPSPSPSP
jgi:alternate signal-mediated exported protein